VGESEPPPEPAGLRGLHLLGQEALQEGHVGEALLPGGLQVVGEDLLGPVEPEVGEVGAEGLVASGADGSTLPS